ncbi:MAG TPA: divalent metal cation transporter [Gemmatimonadales bacterium]|nr:divalent metal cation transporter [Gemmatimonadales bacterium]
MKPRQALEITLGIITSIGGFLDVGMIATAGQAGARFGFRHLWVIAFGTLCTIFLVEMSGRFAAVSKHTIRGAMRERLGANFFVLTLILSVVVNLLVTGAEIAGVSLALELVSGVAARWWAVPVALLVWLLLWKATFGALERGVALLGLVTLAFVVGAVRTHPEPAEVLHGFVPGGPGRAGDGPAYWFIAVSILGAIISPYLFYFYSSGAVEDRWDRSYLGINRVVASVGMSFGGVVAAAVLVGSAMVLLPRGIRVERYEEMLPVLGVPLGRAGFYLFAASLGIACLGAALEATLSTAYELAQGFGWRWGQSVAPREAPRFALAYTVVVAAAAVPTLLGADPLKLTIFSMALTALALPPVIVPFVVLMNDRRYLGEHRNGPVGNAVVIGIIALAFVLALVSIPLQVLGE